jgi:hypothetical protein
MQYSMDIILNVLKAALALSFRYYSYSEAILKLRELIEEENYRNHWNSVIELIIYRKFKKGEALSLIQNDANLLLYYNSDEEAYRWLDLMLINSLGKGEIIPYQNIGE